MENTIVRVTDPKTFVEKVAEAQRLHKEGKKVIILVDDIDELCKIYDTEVICDMLSGLPFEESEQYSWAQMAMKSRQKWIEDEAKETNESRRNQTN